MDATLQGWLGDVAFEMLARSVNLEAERYGKSDWVKLQPYNNSTEVAITDYGI